MRFPPCFRPRPMGALVTRAVPARARGGAVISRSSLVGSALIVLAGCPTAGAASPPQAADTTRYVILSAGSVGERLVWQDEDGVHVQRLSYRGRALESRVQLGKHSLPEHVEITGTHPGGYPIRERFEEASEAGAFYASLEYEAAFQLPFLANALLASPEGTLRLLPDGEARIEEMGRRTVEVDGRSRILTHYAIHGLDLAPEYVWLDEDGALFADDVSIREGWERAHGWYSRPDPPEVIPGQTLRFTGEGEMPAAGFDLHIADGEEPALFRFRRRDAAQADDSAFAPMIGGAWNPTAAQDPRASEIIELNRRIMHQQIIERDPALFQEVSLDQFLVVAPGGRVENKAEAVAGVSGWDVESIELRDEHVIFEGNTAVLVGRLQVNGVMRPVGSLPPMKFMAVFVETGGGWRLLARSQTPCFELAIQRGFC
jgi:hypothetical protein